MFNSTVLNEERESAKNDAFADLYFGLSISRRFRINPYLAILTLPNFAGLIFFLTSSIIQRRSPCFTLFHTLSHRSHGHHYPQPSPRAAWSHICSSCRQRLRLPPAPALALLTRVPVLVSPSCCQYFTKISTLPSAALIVITEKWNHSSNATSRTDTYRITHLAVASVARLGSAPKRVDSPLFRRLIQRLAGQRLKTLRTEGFRLELDVLENSVLSVSVISPLSFTFSLADFENHRT